MNQYKQAIVVRADLGMSAGKIAAQGAHASVLAAMDSGATKEWLAEGGAKIVLACDGEAEALSIVRAANKLGVTAYAVRDAGRTEVAPGTVTCVAVGPADKRMVNKITGNLKLL